MNSNVSGLNKMPYLQTAPNTAQPVVGNDADGDNDGSSGSARIGKSNFMSAIEQALGQSLSDNAGVSSATSSSAKDPQAALQAFLHNLISALHQQATSNGVDTAGNNGGSSSAVGSRPRGGLSANIQGLLQQLSSNKLGASKDSPGSDALDSLNSSYQNLINAINAHKQGSSTTNLQSFLQNLQQDLNGGQSISGAVVNTTA